MAEFTVNPTRYDPYKTHMFRVKFGGDAPYVAGLSTMSALTRSTTAVTHRTGGDPAREAKSPGMTSYQAVTFGRGVTHDLAFEEWAERVASTRRPGPALADFRRDVVVDVYNEAGQKALSYVLLRCWVSQYQALPALDAATAATAIQTLTLELEGWQRDVAVTEPVELGV